MQITTKIIYRFDISAQEYGVIIKALEAHGRKAQALAAIMEDKRNAFREEMSRQFETSLTQKED